MDIIDKFDDKTAELMKQYMHVKRREKSAEVKLAAVTPQEVPKGFIPYFKIIGRAHTINDNNYFGVFFPIHMDQQYTRW